MGCDWDYEGRAALWICELCAGVEHRLWFILRVQIVAYLDLASELEVVLEKLWLLLLYELCNGYGGVYVNHCIVRAYLLYLICSCKLRKFEYGVSIGLWVGPAYALGSKVVGCTYKVYDVPS